MPLEQNLSDKQQFRRQTVQAFVHKDFQKEKEQSNRGENIVSSSSRRLKVFRTKNRHSLDNISKENASLPNVTASDGWSNRFPSEPASQILQVQQASPYVAPAPPLSAAKTSKQRRVSQKYQHGPIGQEHVLNSIDQPRILVLQKLFDKLGELKVCVDDQQCVAQEMHLAVHQKDALLDILKRRVEHSDLQVDSLRHALRSLKDEKQFLEQRLADVANDTSSGRRHAAPFVTASVQTDEQPEVTDSVQTEAKSDAIDLSDISVELGAGALEGGTPEEAKEDTTRPASATCQLARFDACSGRRHSSPLEKSKAVEARSPAHLNTARSLDESLAAQIQTRGGNDEARVPIHSHGGADQGNPEECENEKRSPPRKEFQVDTEVSSLALDNTLHNRCAKDDEPKRLLPSASETGVSAVGTTTSTTPLTNMDPRLEEDPSTVSIRTSEGTIHTASGRSSAEHIRTASARTSEGDEADALKAYVARLEPGCGTEVEQATGDECDVWKSRAMRLANLVHDLNAALRIANTKMEAARDLAQQSHKPSEAALDAAESWRTRHDSVKLSSGDTIGIQGPLSREQRGIEPGGALDENARLVDREFIVSQSQAIVQAFHELQSDLFRMLEARGGPERAEREARSSVTPGAGESQSLVRANGGQMRRDVDIEMDILRQQLGGKEERLKEQEEELRCLRERGEVLKQKLVEAQGKARSFDEEVRAVQREKAALALRHEKEVAVLTEDSRHVEAMLREKEKEVREKERKLVVAVATVQRAEQALGNFQGELCRAKQLAQVAERTFSLRSAQVAQLETSLRERDETITELSSGWGSAASVRRSCDEKATQCAIPASPSGAAEGEVTAGPSCGSDDTVMALRRQLREKCDEARNLSVVRKGGPLIKYGHKRLRSKQRWFVLSTDAGSLVWTNPKGRWLQPKAKSSVSLSLVREILYGATTTNLKRQSPHNVVPWQCFSLVLPDRTLDLAAPSVDTCLSWILGLKAAILDGQPGLVLPARPPLQNAESLSRPKLHWKLAGMRAAWQAQQAKVDVQTYLRQLFDMVQQTRPDRPNVTAKSSKQKKQHHVHFPF